MLGNTCDEYYKELEPVIFFFLYFNINILTFLFLQNLNEMSKYWYNIKLKDPEKKPFEQCQTISI